MCDRCLTRSRAFRIMWQKAQQLKAYDAIAALKAAYADAAHQINDERAKGEQHHEISDPGTVTADEYATYLSQEAAINQFVDSIQESVQIVEVDPKSFPAYGQNPEKLKN